MNRIAEYFPEAVLLQVSRNWTFPSNILKLCGTSTQGGLPSLHELPLADSCRLCPLRLLLQGARAQVRSGHLSLVVVDLNNCGCLVRFMAERKPYELKGIILAYNLFQTVFSAWGFYQVSFRHFILSP